MPFSSRLHWEFRTNPLYRLLERKRASGEPLLDLTESNPTRAGFSYDQTAILNALADPRALGYDPHPAGARMAREAVAVYYARRGQPVDFENIVLTSGTSEAYEYVFKLLADPGDEILTPAPSYPLFEYLAALESVVAKPYPLVLHRSWRVDLEALREAVTVRTRALVVVSPNNPTGNFMQTEELRAIEGLCAESGVAIICDEVFSDFVLTESRDSASTIGVNDALCFTLNGLSKIAGLPQMKLAWIVVNGPDELRRKAVERLELIADTYLSVGTVQFAAPRLLADSAGFQQQVLVRLRNNLDFLRNEAGKVPMCSLLPVDGGWYAILRLPLTRSEEDWGLSFLDLDDVLVQPGYFYDLHYGAHAVLSLLTPSNIFREGAGRILARVATG